MSITSAESVLLLVVCILGFIIKPPEKYLRIIDILFVVLIITITVTIILEDIVLIMYAIK